MHNLFIRCKLANLSIQSLLVGHKEFKGIALFDFMSDGAENI